MSAWRHPRLSCGAFPRENDSPAPRLRALTAFPRRERVVYPDGNRDAVAALSALLAPDVQLTSPDVRVLPADASPAKANARDFPVTPGAAMPAVAGCKKQDYWVVFVVALEAGSS